MNIKLMEAFSNRMEEYIGPARWKKMEAYLSTFDHFDAERATFFDFPNDQEAFKVTKKIMEDAKALVAESKGGPALDYILFRCAGIINSSGQALNKTRSASLANDVTGTGYGEFIGYISEAYIMLAEPTGVIDKFPLDKYSYGDLMNNVSARLGLELKNKNRDLMAQEHSNGVNYDGVRTASVVKFDKATGKYYDKKTGEEVTEEEAKELQSKANIRRMHRAKSFDGTDTNDYNDDKGQGSSMDKLMADYASASGDNLGEFEDRIVDELGGSDIVNNWEDCCMDSEWTKKDNIKAKILKTLINDMVEGKVSDQKTFISMCGLNKQTFRNYMGLTDRETYPGVTIPDILDDYEVDITELVKYLKDNPSKKDAMLSLLPGEKLHEALKRYMNKKRIQESKKSTSDVISLNEDAKMYFESFKSAIKEAVSKVDWTETDGSDVKTILESTLKDGIDAHKNTWKFMAGTFDVGMTKLQKKIVCEALK